ncbi:MAG: hypothetical protein PHD74_04800 [Candidatus Krumholzibacteria bacterium]|nr:hypothetical protein [Candidatus Krumholzibacteria bacterium]
MRIPLKYCIFSAILILLACIPLSQAHAEWEPTYDSMKKIIPPTNYEPKIDYGEPGDDPGLKIGTISTALAAERAQIIDSSMIPQRINLYRQEALRLYLMFWLGQLFW